MWESPSPPNIPAAIPVPEVAAARTATIHRKPGDAPNQSGNTDPPKTAPKESHTKADKEDGKGVPQTRKAQSDAEEQKPKRIPNQKPKTRQVPKGAKIDLALPYPNGFGTVFVLRGVPQCCQAGRSA